MTIDTSFSKITLTAEELSAVAISTIRATIGAGKYQYLSGPITGGQRFVDWHCKIGGNLPDADYKSATWEAVVAPNISAIQAAARAERDAGRNTIEPGSFEAKFPQWGQKEFLDFWERVIKDHAAPVRFMDGWAYSAGCAFEYVCAMRCGLETLDIRGQALAAETALGLLDSALAEIWSKLSASGRRNAPIAELHDKILARRREIEAHAAS